MDKNNKEKNNFFLQCKQKVKDNDMKGLIINDSKYFPPPMYSNTEILVSQYGIALLEDAVSTFLVKSRRKFPIPILYAAYQKLIDKEDYENAILMIENLKTSSTHNKYLILYNIVKLYSYLQQESKAIFFSETLLRESSGNFEYGIY